MRAASAVTRLAQQVRAHTLVYAAIRDGRLTRGTCEVCGAEKTDAHHDDYGEPLRVRWLCRLHHALAHKQLRATTSWQTISLKQFNRQIDSLDDVVTVLKRDAAGSYVTSGVWIPARLIDEYER